MQLLENILLGCTLTHSAYWGILFWALDNTPWVCKKKKKKKKKQAC